MRIDPLGEGAAILRDFEFDPAVLATAIEAAGLPGLQEAVACYDTVGVYFDPGFDLEPLRSVRVEGVTPFGSRHLIPVCYEIGEDLDEVASFLGMEREEVVAAHASVEFRCFAVGFCPGFPYLGYLPEAISGIPRRDQPRQRVPVGSVALTGRQTGVYSMERPGGWAILGRTPLVIVDVEDRYFPIQAGDSVRFEPIGEAEFRQRQGERL
jgi:inhibitor of KinA